VSALNLTAADLMDVEADEGLSTSTAAGVKNPPSAESILWLRGFIEEAAGQFAGSEAEDYAHQRWGITPTMATELSLGFTPAGVTGDYIPYPWRTCPRIVVPLLGFDGVARGLQGRALQEDPTRWCSLANPQDEAWSRLGVLIHEADGDYIQLGEGPGDALTAYATGTSSVFLRGTSMVAGAIDQIIAGCQDKVVVLAGDADAAGREFNRKLGDALTAEGIVTKEMTMPTGVEDVADWREKKGAGFPRIYTAGLRGALPYNPKEPTPDDGDTNTPDTTPTTTGWTKKRYQLTEEGNAQRLIDYMGGDIVSCPQIGSMIYNNGCWQFDELNVIEKKFTEVTYLMLQEGEELFAKGEARDDATMKRIGQALKSHALRSQNSPMFPNSIKRAAKLTAKPLSTFDRHKMLLNVGNGTVNLKTGELQPHRREDWLTHKLTVDYNPEATCQRWHQFLTEIFPEEPEMPDYIQRIAGYAATGETREQCLICSVGIGANGKSILWGTIETVLDNITGSVPFSAFEKRSGGASTVDLAYLRGKRMALVQEGEANTLLAESTIKRATSGTDSISARHLYKSPMKFYPEFLIVMATNSLPRIRGADEGIWRRIRLVKFNRYFKPEERDPFLFEKLHKESEGILKWIVDGAVKWNKHGLGDPASVQQATQSYRDTSDELAGFVGTSIIADPDGEIAGATLMGLYLDWSIEENVKAWSRRALYGALCERHHGVEKVKRKDGVHLTGLRKATTEDTDTEEF
tara:strand:+ start:3565 stop:5805 length:2241 start_codon:yes stop_codon:yes gene_type:complete